MMKICVIGGGSTYTPELIEGFINIHEQIQLKELWLLDLKQNDHKFGIVADFARRMVQKANCGVALHSTFTPQEAIEGADFIIHQFRPGGLQGRIADETIPLRYGLIGQETTGMGGMACALRAFPILEQYVELAKHMSNQAWIINFSNPSGMLTEFIRNYLQYERTIGLCNYPINVLRSLQNLFGCQQQEIFVKYYGLNHLSWIEQVMIQGIDRTADLWQSFHLNPKNIPDAPFPLEFLEQLGLLPNPYLKYFYMTDTMLQQQCEAQQAQGTRGEIVQAIETELLNLYADPSLDHKPPQLEQRGGALYSTAAAELIHDLVTGARTTHIINTRNNGAIQDFPDNYIMEIPVTIIQQGTEPLMLGNSHKAVSGLIVTIKNFERLVIEGYLQKNEDLIRQAMLIHPLGPRLSHVEPLWQALKTANAGFMDGYQG
ncbi:6-phospho-beta-glucosidase BglT [Candidatus Vecturithrix granuli]|uniref:6-phospho-beta-glucosidase BglT n=1 Tax=Vecturithrix granuli TaxID=1499967 RepID=A0A081C2H8_VECG1|nr:6-phospho-beta-glucosidase BglT [Candidatus Vecturithrix granuli]